MGFQTSVIPTFADGIIGEILYQGPTRAAEFNLVSGGTPNIIGHAYTHVSGVDLRAAAGAIGGGAFAGILCFPKEHASYGSSAGTLEPTLEIPDNASGSLLTMGEIIVSLAIVGTGLIGEPLFYNDLTGELGSGTPAVGFTAISNAKISRKNVTAGAGPTLAVIRLTEPE